VSTAMAWLRRVVRASKFLFTVRAALPKYIAILIALGLLPIPGPVDELALVAALAVLVLRHRPLLRVCWSEARW